MIPWLNHCRKRAVVIFEGNDDVFIEILIRLPIKSLLKCKCVCKGWCHLISDPFFICNYSLRNPHHRVSGFYLQKFLLLQLYSELKFIAFDGQNEAAPQSSLSFIEDERGVCIQHSCNGLLVCSSFRCHEEDRIYYICKPTTKQYFPLPRLECKTVICINVAFDPNKSPNYSIICICDSKVSAYHRQIKIYNSDTGSWRVSGNPFFASDDMLFNRGAFWNGALHWVGRGGLSLRFDVEREVLVRMPMPPIHEGWVERRLGYFGESGGHLYLIEIYGPNTAVFDVMEMNRDYSGWFAKYHVNLNEVAGEYPAMVRENVQEIRRFVFSIMHMIHRGVGEKEETLMVLHIPGKFISYNLMDQTFKDLRDISDDLLSLRLEYSWEGVHPYTNTLSYI